MKTAVVGCRSDQRYLSHHYHDKTALIFWRLRPAVARSETCRPEAQQYGIKASTYEEILADGVHWTGLLNLTPAPAHYEIIKRPLRQGNMYTRKEHDRQPGEANGASQASEEKGLYLGSAPDTFLVRPSRPPGRRLMTA